ncbi:mono/diheme cytochrome c family protein [Lewinella aquimaris]|uniref:Mono/diheme cytochrome c family protein n=1 Tax=Neolewinella aquimaris TaxID=1835722 RepID=A0A840E4V9_9BACT|nr:c-type cytochrome [Neolewinella aquimaris]MBB4078983.1 mono/diheme cytochrome c family protein [Neolewinella aquimaris]
MRKLFVFLAFALLVACNKYMPLTEVEPVSDAPWKSQVIPASPQPEGGDPVAGLDYLIHGDYIGSGVPMAIMRKQAPTMPQDSLYPRNALNEGMPYFMTAFLAPNGAETVNGNCFTCHSGEVDGQLVLGLGDSWSDYEKSMVVMGQGMRIGMGLKYKKEDPEVAAFKDFGRYFKVMAPKIKTTQPGANPAFRLAEACMMHRDPEDLTYVDEPQYEMWDYNIATDTPPLWNVKKKNALYYNGIGRGSMPKLLLQASVLGVPDSTHSRKSVEAFKDVYAWLQTLEPPAYPGEVDEVMAREGELLFNDKCAGCHGTYGAEETYPNKVIHLDVVKTDRLYADYIRQSGIVEWYNKSWFATSEPKSYFQPTDGYVAPPLDGIWASAPYLHNGSVPTIYELLDSKSRPDRWTRSGDTKAYDHERLGWLYDPEPKNKQWTFDTTVPGYGNGGHTFGDKLSDRERWAVVEYLKTL